MRARSKVKAWLSQQRFRLAKFKQVALVYLISWLSEALTLLSKIYLLFSTPSFPMATPTLGVTPAYTHSQRAFLDAYRKVVQMPEPLRLHQLCAVISMQCTKHSMFCSMQQGKAVAFFFLNATFFFLSVVFMRVCCRFTAHAHGTATINARTKEMFAWIFNTSCAPLATGITVRLQSTQRVPRQRQSGGKAMCRMRAQNNVSSSVVPESPRRTGPRVKLTSSLWTS